MGDYRLSFSKEQYLPETKSVTLSGPDEKVVEVDLKCACGSVTLEADHPEANIIFAGRILGKGQAVLRTLKFGRYSAVAYLPTGEMTRKVGTAVFELNTQQGKVVRITLDRNQRRFGGKWVDEASALSDEERRYKEQRIDKPIAMAITLA